MKKTGAASVAPDEMKIAYPALTVGRKGAYELRAAVQGLGIRLVTVGAQLEGSDFWRGVSIEERTDQEDWLRGVKLVVLPAFVEHKPRRLLQAVACGIPVIASKACGLENVKGVISVPWGEVETLRREIEKLLSVTKNG
jgi:glycosyltransferase involved in cell wall biosynthesis